MTEKQNPPTELSPAQKLLRAAEAMIANERSQSLNPLPPKKTHHIARITWTDNTGTHDGGEVRVHVSRNCSNCSADGARDTDWADKGGIEAYGRCMNLIGAADDQNKANQWCPEHSTKWEWNKGIKPRVSHPAFVVVEGGAV